VASEGSEVSRAEERGLEQLILFSDAVVANAITLLLLPVMLLLIPIAQRVLDAVLQGRRRWSPQPRSQPSS